MWSKNIPVHTPKSHARQPLPEIYTRRRPATVLAKADPLPRGLLMTLHIQRPAEPPLHGGPDHPADTGSFLLLAAHDFGHCFASLLLSNFPTSRLAGLMSLAFESVRFY